jgi:hypothetical protein
LVGTGRFDIHLSVPLVLEYEDALSRQVAQGQVKQSVVDAVLDFHCRVARRHPIFFLWRPFLRDPCDDMVLELAVKSFAMSTLSLRLPESLHKQVKELARREGISINQFIATAVAEKMSALLTEEYLEERARRGSREQYEAALAEVPDGEPDEWDRL